MGAKKYFIVWNDSRTEGFITDDEDDATYASTGDRLALGVSVVGGAFYEAYSDDGEDEGFEAAIQCIEITPPDPQP